MTDHLIVKTTIMTNDVDDIVISEQKWTCIAFTQLYLQNVNFRLGSYQVNVGAGYGLYIYRCYDLYVILVKKKTGLLS